MTINSNQETKTRKDQHPMILNFADQQLSSEEQKIEDMLSLLGCAAALSEADKGDDIPQVIDALLGLADCASRLRRFALGFSFVNEAFGLAEDYKLPEQMVDVDCMFALVCWRGGRIETAIDYLKSARRRLATVLDLQRMAQVNLYSGQVSLVLGDTITARDYFQAVLSLSPDLASGYSFAALNGMASVALLRGDRSFAIQYTERALEHVQTGGERISTLLKLGAVHRLNQSHEKAIRYWKQAFELLSCIEHRNKWYPQISTIVREIRGDAELERDIELPNWVDTFLSAEPKDKSNEWMYGYAIGEKSALASVALGSWANEHTLAQFARKPLQRDWFSGDAEDDEDDEQRFRDFIEEIGRALASRDLGKNLSSYDFRLYGLKRADMWILQLG